MLSGTTGKMGSYPFTVAVRDGHGFTAQHAYTLVVGKALTTLAITRVAPQPSRAKEAIAITLALSHSGPAPTGRITVTAGAQSCSATLPALSCTLALPTVGTYQISGRYAGDATFAASVSPALSHLVVPDISRVFTPLLLRR